MRAAGLVAATLALGVAGLLALVWAQGGLEPVARWAMEGQRTAQNAMAGALRSLRAGEAGALAALMGLAFGYGVLHAAGPGHGKLLIGGYGAASAVRLGPLAGIALAGSLGQATTAVVLVHGGVALLGWSRERVLGLSEGVLAQVSLVAIGLIGVWLAFRGVRGLVRLAQPVPVLAGHGHGHGDGHHHHGADCGHRHGPTAEEISGLRGWRDAVALVGAIAIRPCTGALFLLILTWRMGISAAGIAGVYVMALGTAVVTVGVAVLAVLARDGALHWAGRFGGRLAGLRPLAPVLELAVGLGVAALAVQALRLGW